MSTALANAKEPPKTSAVTRRHTPHLGPPVEGRGSEPTLIACPKIFAAFAEGVCWWKSGGSADTLGRVIRNIIFDWSGTLVDDLPAVWKATNSVFVQAQCPELTLEQFRA